MPAIAQAKSSGVRIEKMPKVRTVSKPLKIQAIVRGKPRKVTFSLDRKRIYVAYGAPFRFGGPNGTFDTNGLSVGRHRVVVSAYFGKGASHKRVSTATIRVRKTRVAIASRAVKVKKVTTNLPVAGAEKTAAFQRTEFPTWNGSADVGYGPWDLIHRIGDGSEIDIVDSPIMPGHKAFRFVMTDGERAELGAYNGSDRFNEGSQWWFGDVLYIPSKPNKTVGWVGSAHHTLMQWKNDGTGSPPLELDRREDGLELKINTGGNQYLLVPEKSLYDRAIPIEVRVKFSSSSSQGEVEAWVDGKLKVATTRAATLMPGKFSYFKEGQYGPGRGNVVYWQGVYRGTSRASVVR